MKYWTQLRRLLHNSNWPYKKATIPFEQSLFAQAGNDKHMLLQSQKSVTTHANLLELPASINETDEQDEDIPSEQDVDSEVFSGSSDSD